MMAFRSRFLRPKDANSWHGNIPEGFDKPSRCQDGKGASHESSGPDAADSETSGVKFMRFGISMACSAVIFLAASEITASASIKEAVVLGPGNASCGTWTESRRENSSASAALTGWVLGYVSGYNAFNETISSITHGEEPGSNLKNDPAWNAAVAKFHNITSGTDVNGVFAAIDKYCNAHPLHPLFVGTQDVIFELMDGAHKALNRALEQNTEDLFKNAIEKRAK
jgi:hypothetical protein